eukprot:s662_g31.t1
MAFAASDQKIEAVKSSIRYDLCRRDEFSLAENLEQDWCKLSSFRYGFIAVHATLSTRSWSQPGPEHITPASTAWQAAKRHAASASVHVPEVLIASAAGNISKLGGAVASRTATEIIARVSWQVAEVGLDVLSRTSKKLIRERISWFVPVRKRKRTTAWLPEAMLRRRNPMPSRWFSPAVGSRQGLQLLQPTALYSFAGHGQTTPAGWSQPGLQHSMQKTHPSHPQWSQPLLLQQRPLPLLSLPHSWQL